MTQNHEIIVKILGNNSKNDKVKLEVKEEKKILIDHQMLFKEFNFFLIRNFKRSPFTKIQHYIEDTDDGNKCYKKTSFQNTSKIDFEKQYFITFEEEFEDNITPYDLVRKYHEVYHDKYITENTRIFFEIPQEYFGHSLSLLPLEKVLSNIVIADTRTCRDKNENQEKPTSQMILSDTYHMDLKFFSQSQREGNKIMKEVTRCANDSEKIEVIGPKFKKNIQMGYAERGKDIRKKIEKELKNAKMEELKIAAIFIQSSNQIIKVEDNKTYYLVRLNTIADKSQETNNIVYRILFTHVSSEPNKNIQFIVHGPDQKEHKFSIEYEKSLTFQMVKSNIIEKFGYSPNCSFQFSESATRKIVSIDGHPNYDMSYDVYINDLSQSQKQPSVQNEHSLKSDAINSEKISNIIKSINQQSPRFSMETVIFRPQYIDKNVEI